MQCFELLLRTDACMLLLRTDACMLLHTSRIPHTRTSTSMYLCLEHAFITFGVYLDFVFHLLQVYDWLNSNLLTAFAPTFSKHKIDSLHKASLMTRDQVGILYFQSIVIVCDITV
jgi:hypothetical protein